MKFIKKQSFPVLMMFAFFLLLIMFVISILLGAADTSLKDIGTALFSKNQSDASSIIRHLRLPREIAAICVGAALAVAGSIMQGLTRNPLAEPGLLGLTAGASAFLALTIAFFPSLNYFGIMIACFIGASLGMGMVFSIGAMKRGGLSPFRIVLAGAAVSAFLLAIEQGIGLYFKISKNISMWTAGGLIGTNWKQLTFIIPFIVCGLIIAMLLARQLTILSLHEEVAIGLGQNTFLIKCLLFIVIILLAGASVALIGNIIFVGLMIPHIVRVFVGTDYRYIIPMSAIFGAIFMLFADTIARMINAPFETPIIAIVAVLGFPYFLYIIRKGGHSIL